MLFSLLAVVYSRYTVENRVSEMINEYLPVEAEYERVMEYFRRNSMKTGEPESIREMIKTKEKIVKELNVMKGLVYGAEEPLDFNEPLDVKELVDNNEQINLTGTAKQIEKLKKQIRKVTENRDV